MSKNFIPNQVNYIPVKLPCGKEINKDRFNECCMTVCKNKTAKDIDICYAVHKDKEQQEKKREFIAASKNPLVGETVNALI
jgi:hypothetical protein